MSEEHKAWVHCYECHRRNEDWKRDEHGELINICEVCSWSKKTKYVMEDKQC